MRWDIEQKKHTIQELMQKYPSLGIEWTSLCSLTQENEKWLTLIQITKGEG